MDVGCWLRSLGLEHCEAAFRENEIDETVLSDLTEDHFREIGIPLGARIKLLKAIAALEAGTKETSRRHPDAQRRQVTVMFSDLVGSTALAGRLDPEDLREIISAYQKCVAATVRRFGGYVAKYLGDGALAYFGYPQAHEDDAERAVRAGLQLIAAVTGLETHASLRTRVGIATGLVVVGDLIGSGEAQQREIVGKTANLAARLQEIAEPNTVVIPSQTRLLLGSLFELEDLGSCDLKGIDTPTRVWSVVGPSSVESRFEALRAGHLTALVGREEEMNVLLQRWSMARTGAGQVVLLSGEAGIGKSRLTAVLLERLSGELHARVRYFCSPQDTDSAFYPIIGQMERAASLARDDTLTAKLDKFDSLLAQTSTSEQDAALLAELLSLPNDGRYPALDLAPQQRRQKTIDALIRQIGVLACSSPILMILEDAHWIDPTSLEVLGRVVDRIASLRALFVITHRPEFQPPWLGQPHVTALTINRLTERDTETMLDRLIGEKVIPTSIRQAIFERADGVPLFIEEMTKSVLETGDEDEAQRTVGAIPSPVIAVPASLQASLMARLDRLGRAKEVAQIAAALGRDFSHSLLSAVANISNVRLQGALDQLVGAGLLFGQGRPPHSTYLFKHALVRDVAYGALLRASRRALHACIAETIESQFADVAEKQPQLLARHYTEAGLVEKAANLWAKAGQRSLERSAMMEAVAQCHAALKLLSTLPESEQCRRSELKVQIVLAKSLVAIHGAAALEPAQAYDRARVLCEILCDTVTLPWIVMGQWYACLISAKHRDGIKHAKTLLQLGKRRNENRATWKTLAKYGIGHCLFALGEFNNAQIYLEEALVLNQFELSGGGVATWAMGDARIIALGYLQQCYFVSGRLAKAQETERRALVYAASLAQPYARAVALVMNCRMHAIQRDVTVVSERAKELLALGDENGFLMFIAFGKIYLGWAMALGCEASAGAELCHTGIVVCRSAGIRLALSLHLGLYAEALYRADNRDRALTALREAVQEGLETDEHFWEAELFRLEGEFASDRALDLGRAETCLRQALAVARHQGARLLELRAATSLARLCVRSGRRAAVSETLMPIFASFEKEFDIAELTDARALLESCVAEAAVEQTTQIRVAPD
jgi:predicted ATPase/class 3 adenylate cyclase